MMGIFLTYMKQEPEIQGTWIEGQTKVLMKQKIYQSFVFSLSNLRRTRYKNSGFF